MEALWRFLPEKAGASLQLAMSEAIVFTKKAGRRNAETADHRDQALEQEQAPAELPANHAAVATLQQKEGQQEQQMDDEVLALNQLAQELEDKYAKAVSQNWRRAWEERIQESIEI